tara:strand:+ start:580 stop:984 length:405 start_codon:yes stop_codon:yes gene_type:complete
MAAYQYKTGLYNVGSFQVSGRPWITGSTTMVAGQEDRIVFPSVTKSIMIVNDDPGASEDDIYVHFNATGSGNVIAGKHYFNLSSNGLAITFNVKCREIYVSNPTTETTGYTIVAELTGIAADEMPPLAGSGLTD